MRARARKTNVDSFSAHLCDAMEDGLRASILEIGTSSKRPTTAWWTGRGRWAKQAPRARAFWQMPTTPLGAPQHDGVDRDATNALKRET